MSSKNVALREVLRTGLYSHVHVLPFYELTRPRWRWHFGNCSARLCRENPKSEWGVGGGGVRD